MKEEEPLLHSRLISHPDKILDFKMMKDFALDSVHYYSKDRWALSGEAASFTDAFYSPGLDFIALGNTWISSLILSDSKGMDIYAQSMIYELMHKRLFSGWLTLYQDQYSALGNTALMLMKVIWDWSAYWSIQCLMFKNHGYTDVGIIKEFSSQNDQLGQRFAILNQSMQNLFKDWNQEAAFSFAGISHNVFDLGFMKKFQEELHLSIPKTELISKLKANIEILEKIAVSIYCLVYERYKHKLNENRINPYEMQLNDSIDQIVQKSHSVSAILPDSVILEDVRRFWLYENSSPAASHV
jgi:hypothetical protein